MPSCADDFRGLGSGAPSFLNLLVGGALELFNCLVLPLEALLSRDVAVESEGELLAHLVGRFRFVAFPRSVDEVCGAFIVRLERFFRVLDPRVLPFDFRSFRERSPASFAVIALFTERSRPLSLWLSVRLRPALVAWAFVATAALLDTLALRFFDLKACFEDSRELDFDVLVLLLLAGDPVELLAFLDVRLEPLLVCDLDKARDRRV